MVFDAWQLLVLPTAVAAAVNENESVSFFV